MCAGMIQTWSAKAYSELAFHPAAGSDHYGLGSGTRASFQSDGAMHVPPPATTVMAQLLPQLVNYRCCQNGRY